MVGQSGGRWKIDFCAIFFSANHHPVGFFIKASFSKHIQRVRDKTKYHNSGNFRPIAIKFRKIMYLKFQFHSYGLALQISAFSLTHQTGRLFCNTYRGREVC